MGNPARLIRKGDTKHNAPSAHPDRAEQPSRSDQTPEPARDAAALAPCETGWNGKPLQELLRRGTGESTDPEHEAFTAYAVDRTDDDPLLTVLHELINHAASQELRIGKLCRALEDLGQRVENGQTPLDVDRLNRLVE